MSPVQKKMLLAGIKIKLARGDKLEDVLIKYTKLTDSDKTEIQNIITGGNR